MNYLAPSILAADFCELGSQLDIIEQSEVPYIHVDVMDGMFVPSISFGMPVLECVRTRTKRFLDVHMMVQSPERYVDEFMRLGADGITIHVEACDCVHETLAHIKSLGGKCGIAINPETPVEQAFPYLEEVDMVLVMTVRPGFGGQSYIRSCLDKIKGVRSEISKRGLPVDVEIDGGVRLGNLKENLDAGANIIVTGSAIFKGDIQQNIDDFYNIMNEKK
ncbi:MAG: ribulose-phosphate 3-epimerase [Lachnospiraceae bacterium]|nr:ribulose-phosphate 3-epimerase [Lachnospiraceae bacterium]